MSLQPCRDVVLPLLFDLGLSGSHAAADGPQQRPPERVAISVTVSPSPSASAGYEGVVAITDLDRNIAFGAATFSFGSTHRARFRANVHPNSITFEPDPDSSTAASVPPPSGAATSAVSLLVDVAVPPAGSDTEFTVTYLLAGRPQAKASGHFTLRHSPEA